MTARTKLKRALGSIDDAVSALKRANGSADRDAASYIRRALSDLDDAEAAIKRAIRELPAES